MSPSAADICRRHLTFLVWADERMLEAVAEHMPDRLATFQHVYLAAVVWFDRVSGNESAMITQYAAPGTIAELQQAFREVHAKWLAWAQARDDFEVVIPHRNLQGELFGMPAWQIVLHLANHGSYHRGQVAAMLREAGFAPPATDLIIWYRQQG